VLTRVLSFLLSDPFCPQMTGSTGTARKRTALQGYYGLLKQKNTKSWIPTFKGYYHTRWIHV